MAKLKRCLKIIKNITKLANFAYVRQKKHLPYGNATPLLSVEHLVDNDEAFVYMFGDDMTIPNNGTPVTKQLMDVFYKENAKNAEKRARDCSKTAK
jgi:UTP-glucose-1-phosphate uridylyltransferase